MAWTIAADGFVPVSPEKSILGTLTAVFDDGQTPFIYRGSVNITNQASLADFVVQAKKALAASKVAPPSKAILPMVQGLLNA